MKGTAVEGFSRVYYPVVRKADHLDAAARSYCHWLAFVVRKPPVDESAGQDAQLQQGPSPSITVGTHLLHISRL
jgi:hypothetical protein